MVVSVILNSSSVRNIPSLPPTTRQERLKTTRRRNRFLLPVSIVSALLIPAIILYSQQTIAGDCGPFQQGTEQSNGEFIPGTASTDIDYRGVCSGDQSDGINDASFSNFNDIDLSNPDTRVIIDVTDVSDVSEGYSLIEFTPGNGTNATFVLRGEIDEPAVTDGATVNVYSYQTTDDPLFVENINVESHLNLSNSGDGRRAIAVYNEHGGNVLVRNYGEILTTGDGYLRPANRQFRSRRASGILSGAEGQNLQGQTVGNATAINEAGGRIITEGNGARAISSYSEGGTATAINRGFVETMGDTFEGDGFASRASGVRANSTNGEAIAKNYETVITRGKWADGVEGGSDNDIATAENFGSVNVHGDGASGVRAWSGSTATSSTAINHKTIETHGNLSEGRRSVGLASYSEGGDATATNEMTGNITVRGNDSRGMEVGSGSDGTAIATNKGTISTYGSRSASATFDPHGLVSFSQGGNATAENAAGGSIITRGQGVTGMGASVGFGETGVPDTVVAETINRGTVMSMDDGIWVYSSAGRAVLRNYGSVTAGENKTAVSAYADGSAVAEVTIKGADTVKASGTDSVGVYVEAEQDTGSSTKFPITVDVSNSSITAETAIQLSGQRASVSISDSQILGNIIFDAGNYDDLLNISSVNLRTLISGGVNLGGGINTINFNAATDTLIDVKGTINDVETLTVNTNGGDGDVRVRDVNFTGSTATIENGNLIIGGHFNLGLDGIVNVKNSSKLVFEYNTDTDYGHVTADTVNFDEEARQYVQVAEDSTDPSASQQSFQNNRERLTFIDAATVMENKLTSEMSVTSDDIETFTVMDDGQETEVDGTTMLGMIGSLSQPATTDPMEMEMETTEPMEMETTEPMEMETTEPSESTRDNRSDSSAVGLFAIGMLLWNILDDDEADSVQFQDEFGLEAKNTFRRSSGSLEQPLFDHDTKFNVRSVSVGSPGLSGDSSSSMQGVALDVDSDLGNGFRIGFTTVPKVSVSNSAALVGANSESRMQGEQYALRGRWNRDSWFTNLIVGYSSYSSNSAFGNPVTNEVMSGSYDLNQTHFQLGAGVKMTLGSLQVTPSLDVFSGSMQRESYTAVGPIFNAEVPEQSWQYDGWKAGLSLSPNSMYRSSTGLSWKPSLQMSTHQINSDNPGVYNLSQSDHAGVLDFRTSSLAQQLPDQIHSFSAGVNIKKSDDFGLRLGFSRVIVDNNPVNVAVAQLGMRF